MTKIMICGDLHMREALGYADNIEDKRIPEKQEILDFIVKQSEDCDKVVFLGDNLDARNNPSRVIKEFTAFIERFDGKQVYILSGNHEISGDGTTAIDYLAEIKKPNWHIVCRQKVEEIDGMTFCPYILKSTLDTKSDQEASEKITEMLEKTNGKYLFVHHAISGSSVQSGQDVNTFPEPILPRERLQKKFVLTFGGHIHKHSDNGDNVIVVGSVFNNEVGETEKFIYKITEDNSATFYNAIKLPGRGIYKLENPTFDEIDKLPANSIVKVINTDKKKAIPVEELKVILGDRFDAHMIVEKYPNERTKAHIDKNSTLDFSVENLLSVYAKERKLDLTKLLKGWQLIK